MGQGLLSQPFPRVEGELRCGGFTVAELAERYGTPLYLYDLARIREKVDAFRAAFDGVDLLIAYSVKANGNLTLLGRLKGLGCGADITSLGEMFRARTAGFDPGQVVFAGAGKSAQELREALEWGIYAVNVESAGELRLLDSIAREMGCVAPFAIRVNPDVQAATPHAYTRTGHAETKFGIPIEEATQLYRWAAGRPHLRARGVDVHIGSQIVDPEPYVRALDSVLHLVQTLREDGLEMEFLDIGGGYGISYDAGPEMDLAALARDVVPRVRSVGLRLVVEPGRALVGDAGLLVTRVQYVKRGLKTFVIVDGGMSELIRPSHYGGYHAVERVDAREHHGIEHVDVVGPICETGDFFARDREMELPTQGELLAVRTVGAYGFTMASNYNGRLRPAECLVDGDTEALVRRRERLEDLIRGELPEDLSA